MERRPFPERRPQAAIHRRVRRGGRRRAPAGHPPTPRPRSSRRGRGAPARRAERGAPRGGRRRIRPPQPRRRGPRGRCGMRPRRRWRRRGALRGFPETLTAPGVPGATGARSERRRVRPPSHLPISDETVSAAAAASEPANAAATGPAGNAAARTAKSAGGPPLASTCRAPGRRRRARRSRAPASASSRSASPGRRARSRGAAARNPASRARPRRRIRRGTPRAPRTG